MDRHSRMDSERGRDWRRRLGRVYLSRRESRCLGSRAGQRARGVWQMNVSGLAGSCIDMARSSRSPPTCPDFSGIFARKVIDRPSGKRIFDLKSGETRAMSFVEREAKRGIPLWMRSTFLVIHRSPLSRSSHLDLLYLWLSSANTQ
jgi:hypothetical protein